MPDITLPQDFRMLFQLLQDEANKKVKFPEQSGVQFKDVYKAKNNFFHGIFTFCSFTFCSEHYYLN